MFVHGRLRWVLATEQHDYHGPAQPCCCSVLGSATLAYTHCATGFILGQDSCDTNHDNIAAITAYSAAELMSDTDGSDAYLFPHTATICSCDFGPLTFGVVCPQATASLQAASTVAAVAQAQKLLESLSWEGGYCPFSQPLLAHNAHALLRLNRSVLPSGGGVGGAGGMTFTAVM